MRLPLYESGRYPGERTSRYLAMRPADDPLVHASSLVTAAHAAQDEGRFADADAMLAEAERLLDNPRYADVDEDGQLSLGVAGEQRSIPGLAARREGGDHA
jgi:hypothetical protein